MSSKHTGAQRKRQAAALSADRILNPTSPIADAKTDLHTFFQHCIANWNLDYSEDEKTAIIATLPAPYRNRKNMADASGRLACPLSPDFVATDHVVRDSIARFQRDVKDGYWTATWQRNAIKASEERAHGKFDEYLQQNTAGMFNQSVDEADEAVSDNPSSDEDYQVKRHSQKHQAGQKSSRGTKARMRKEKAGRMAAEVGHEELYA